MDYKLIKSQQHYHRHQASYTEIKLPAGQGISPKVFNYRNKMQGFLEAIRTYQTKLIGNSHLRMTLMKSVLMGHGCATTASSIPGDKGSNDITAAESSKFQQKGLENMTVAEVLMTKEGENVGSWIWCRMDDSVSDAVKQMAQNNIGSLVVLKPGQKQLIAGIVTERDYLRKVIVRDRSSKYTRVGEIMTDQNKLITVTSDTNILQAMQLMTDVVRAVVEQQSGDMKRLNEFIRGEYY